MLHPFAGGSGPAVPVEILDREDWRTFRLDRLAKPASTGVRSAPRDPPSEDVAAYVAKRLSSAPNRYEARVRLHASAEAIAGRVPWARGSIEPIDDRSCEYRAGDDNLDWLALRVAMLGVDFDVHEPPELIEHLHALGRRLGRAANVE